MFAVKTVDLDKLTFKAGWFSDHWDNVGHVEFEEDFVVLRNGKLSNPDWLPTSHMIISPWYPNITEDAAQFVGTLERHNEAFSRWTSARVWDLEHKSPVGYMLCMAFFFSNVNDACAAMLMLSAFRDKTSSKQK